MTHDTYTMREQSNHRRGFGAYGLHVLVAFLLIAMVGCGGQSEDCILTGYCDNPGGGGQGNGGGTARSFTRLEVPGICPIRDDLSQVGLSVTLLDGASSLRPKTRIRGQFVGDLLSVENFGFSQAPQDEDAGIAEPVVVEVDDYTDSKFGVQWSPVGLEYLYAGSEDRQDQEKLVVLIMDHSGSLAGLDPQTGRPANELRSDYRDERISFFNQFVDLLGEDDWMSLVKMNDRGGNIAQCEVAEACGMPERVCSDPTKKREPVKCGLSSLQFNEQGLTPLNETLKRAMDAIIRPNVDPLRTSKPLNPVVVVFTDGTEDGDPSGDLFGENGAASIYKTGIAGQSVPIIFVHLSAPRTSRFFIEPSGRSKEFHKLACETGGEYLFVQSASEFLDNSVYLSRVLSNRVHGVWRMRVDTNLADTQFEPGGYLLSTTLGVILDGQQRIKELQYNPGLVYGQREARLWFAK